jgi:arginine-tRNA-protein transferase
MELAAHFVTAASACGYLPDQVWRLEYDIARTLSAAEYAERMQHGWRRFGHALFRPRCRACSACRSLRVDVARFRPDRSQRRNRKLNEGALTIRVGPPAVTRAKLRLYDRFHAFQSEAKGWPLHAPKDADSYESSFVDNPFPVQEWCYYRGDQLVGVGYVDVLPVGLSAIYFFYEPDERQRGLGVWNVLRLIQYAARCGMPHLYLGYYVAGCPSLSYKANYAPNEVHTGDGVWVPFRP